MSRRILMTVLATFALATTVTAPSSAQSPPTGIAAGTYDSFGRDKNSDNTLPPNLDRIVQIVPNRLGGLRFNVYNRALRLVGTQLLVPRCNITYDGQLASYYQNFETVPGRRGAPAEQVRFVFRINDPVGDYDVYFKLPGSPQTSEVLKRRDP
jgi:hypothetical protein